MMLGNMLGNTLYFFFMSGCEACEAAEPYLREWEKENRKEYMTIRLNVSLKDWAIFGWSPKGTPGYALVSDGALVKTAVGAMTAKELGRWVRAKR